MDATARRALIQLLAERLVRDALAERSADRAIIPPATPDPDHARRPVRPLQLRPATADLDR